MYYIGKQRKPAGSLSNIESGNSSYCGVPAANTVAAGDFQVAVYFQKKKVAVAPYVEPSDPSPHPTCAPHDPTSAPPKRVAGRPSRVIFRSALT